MIGNNFHLYQKLGQIFAELRLQVLTTNEKSAEEIFLTTFKNRQIITNQLAIYGRIDGKMHYSIMDPIVINQLKKGHIARFYFLLNLLKFIKVAKTLRIQKIGSSSTNPITARILVSQYSFEKLGEKSVQVSLEKLKILEPKYIQMLAVIIKKYPEVLILDPNSGVILE